jgi:Domain of unknown function (DUF5911)
LKTLHQRTFQPIENYGLIGNLCTAALVGMDSSIDFFCFPEFDSPTVFAALLDPERGGSFSIRPLISGVQNKQMYAAESNVLITRFLSDSATAEVIDFMPLTHSNLPWAQGVGRSNRPAPTKSPADSKRVDRFLPHRFRGSFASTVPKPGPTSFACRLSFASASRFICNFICEYFLNTFASP